jgi:hypothetical protein
VYWENYDTWYYGKIKRESRPDEEGTHNVRYKIDGETISEVLVPSEKGEVCTYVLLD